MGEIYAAVSAVYGWSQYQPGSSAKHDPDHARSTPGAYKYTEKIEELSPSARRRYIRLYSGRTTWYSERRKIQDFQDDSINSRMVNSTSDLVFSEILSEEIAKAPGCGYKILSQDEWKWDSMLSSWWFISHEIWKNIKTSKRCYQIQPSSTPADNKCSLISVKRR